LKNLNQLLQKITSLRILVIGDVMLDRYIWGDVSRISPEAPVPVVDVYNETWTAGGAANVALNLASLGARVTIAGYIGHDESGAKLTQILEKHKISVLRSSGTAQTIVKTRVLVQRQQLCRIDRESSAPAYKFPVNKFASILAAAISECDAVIMSDYAKGFLDDELVAAIAGDARSKEKFVALDPKPKRKLTFDRLDLITPNKREALELAGMTSGAHNVFPAAEVCARLYHLYKTRNLVVTLGEEGMLLAKAGNVIGAIPTAAREVFDVSGAGDTALSGLVLALVAGQDLESAAHFANAAAGVAVGKLGTAVVSPNELIAYFDNQARIGV